MLPGIAVITLVGPFGSDSRGHVAQTFDQAVAGSSILIDLTACVFLDASVIGVILAEKDRRASRGAHVDIVVAPYASATWREIGAVHTHRFRTYPSRSHGLAALAASIDAGLRQWTPDRRVRRQSVISEADEQFLSETFAALTSYLAERVEHPVSPALGPAELADSLPTLEATGVSYLRLQSELSQIMDKSVCTAHPLFLNNLLAGFDPASWMGEIAASLLNPTMATFEVAPLLTIIEKRMASELLRLFGIDTGQGVMTTGGSNANLLAILCARSNVDSSLRVTGLSQTRFRLYVSEEAHYSFDKAANITGIGTENVVEVRCNDRGEMLAEELEKAIVADLENGYTPLMVGATAGTTVLGAFDPFDQIADICEVYDIWFHVDAAWGGGAAFSESARGLLEGIDRADSITIDAHKTLGVPLIASYFLTRHSHILQTTTRSGGSEYLFHQDDPQWDTGTYSLQCGRRADALKLWLAWRRHGTAGLGARVDKLLDLAEFARFEVSRRSRLKLVSSHYLNVCFQVVPTEPESDTDAFTLNVRQQVVSEGRSLVNYAARRDGSIFIRLVLSNHQTTPADILGLLDDIVDTAEQLELDAYAMSASPGQGGSRRRPA